ncbi:amino acid ABC transporter permease [Gluconobacter kanchanaburiensis]|uniref:Glutamate/aspartate import permease protein GltK n=1 Tax=Gluconobacter kanchanaburiensis NBRC 103587 TaxID=1307948 RepID=A0A511B7P4_9PROT|nr:amino acid ABC transporter permease [Gluconobacter kanchanaburiensis]MBF0862439.1 amino acid ABC transporter permease [Gluconobacter kanchanaburiensis]GBR68641.1 amino acid ABC transporter permease [Gluconobacter kanchanaburiensis NBRC 103587]GEK96439.1 amino acid ABC transporter permease [Gluconobacter kanchanaburiensis NBRC 103587]
MVNWHFVVHIMPRLLRACGVTLEISMAALLMATCLGLGIALGRLSSIRAVSLAAWGYVWILRGTPLLLQLFAVYYAVPRTGFRLDPWSAGILTLGLNSAAYFSEIFRAAIQSIPAGQAEAAAAVGLAPLQILRRIILPQALRPALPPFVGQAITLIKNSSLVSVIAVPDLMLTAQSIYSVTFRVTEVMVATGILYLAITTVLQIAQAWIERRLSYYTVR